MASIDFSNRTCVVIGGTSDIGAKLIEILAINGCNIVFTYYRNLKRAKEIIENLNNRNLKVEAVKVDSSKLSDVCSMIDNIINKYNAINHIAILSGYSDPELWKLKWHELDLDAFIRVFKVDFGSVFNTFKCISNHIEKCGLRSVVTIASTPALVGDTQGYPYLVAKASILAISKSLARALAPRIRVNVVALGSIETKWVNWLNNNEISNLKREILLKRFGKPIEAANAIAFLLSDLSSYINGQILIVDGGEVIPI